MRYVGLLVATILLFRWFISFNLLPAQTMLVHDPRPYTGAEFLDATLPSRQWMTRAMDIVKSENLAPASAARFYAFVASVYADTMEATNNPNQAGAATAALIGTLLPERKPFPTAPLFPATKEIADSYIKRAQNDNYYNEWSRQIPVLDGWYIRDGKVDKGAMAGTWTPWILGKNAPMPVPPAPGSLPDWYERTKVAYAAAQKKKQSDIVYFWHGTRAFVKGQIPDNITPAGVWQNILFVEGSQGETDRSYAQKQKLLAQAVADAFIETWKVKYGWYTKRPSMVLPGFTPMVGDPPFPSFTSGHSTISEAAATVLASLYPEKRTLWYELSRDARNSRLVAGIHFDSDNFMGAAMGSWVGREVLATVGAPVVPSPIRIPQQPNILFSIIHGSLMRAQMALRRIAEGAALRNLSIPKLHTSVPLPQPEKLGGTVAWADIDGDGDDDLFTLQGLYRNDGGVFTAIDSPLHKGGEISSAVFFDYNNDGCVDVYISRYGDTPQTLSAPGAPDGFYKNMCDGTFENVTDSAGIADSLHGFGVAATDYDNDGFTDVYVANWGVMLGSGDAGLTADTYRPEPNMLWKNNGDGTFTDVTARAGVTGFAACPQLRGVAFSDAKPSYQPVWFDYNNDRLQDLFVATDFLISPLYKNNGDGTFTDVTFEAGLCVNGTASNMGVAAADYDGDGDVDLYVTNGGKNDLWRNNGDGTFTDVVSDLAADDRGYGWGVSFLDANNDGRLDILVVNGNNNWSLLHDPGIKQDNTDELLLQNSDGTFTAVGRDAGLTGNEIKRGLAVADYNADGALDAFISSETLPEGVENRFYTDTPSGNGWISFRLTGTRSNRDAIGAVIRLETTAGTQYRFVSAGSSFLSQHSLTQTFGLGRARVRRAEIRWPSGIVQTIDPPGQNRIHAISEPAQ